MGFNGDLYQESGADVVMTTKGDIVRYNTERERYGIGSAGQVLQVASSLPTWSTINLADSVLTTQGDVLVEGASGLERLGQSTDGFVLTTKGAGANPVWASAGGGATVTQSSIEDYTDAQTTTATSFTAYSGGTDVDLTSSGSCMIVHSAMQENNTAGQWSACGISVDGSVVGKTGVGATDTAQYQRQICVSYSMANGGEAINAGWYVSGGTGKLTNGAGVALGTRTSILEVS